MLRALGSFADFFVSPSFTTVAKWIAVISTTSFFAGYVLGYLSGNRREIASLIASIRGEAQSAAGDAVEDALATAEPVMP